MGSNIHYVLCKAQTQWWRKPLNHIQKRACDFDHSPQKMWEDQKWRKKRKEKEVEQEKESSLPTHPSHFSFLLQKMCPHCTIYRGTGPESNHVRDNKLTFTASPFFSFFLLSHGTIHHHSHTKNTSTRAIQKAHNCMMLVFSLFLSFFERRRRKPVLAHCKKDKGFEHDIPTEKTILWSERWTQTQERKWPLFFSSFSHPHIFFTVITMK